ncbi:uncharacterized protein EV422DRAFT_519922 [Fimicolochytrium jonesii]|uniref:uncharacterized protein n=1 Tax=Fimicolochytrium jonesii TaxID=1396493 RepID=UPI0022FEEF25|nr:uncharacterized protein EV422DRAFT_519922 [Fimicolochytrium jonesii]KAI8824381.1 hypothetical protein EV422DRAFT_519922 [Fimicolochytrium jonesii]
MLIRMISLSIAANASAPKKKFTSEQTAALKAHYEENDRPSDAMYRAFSQEVGLTEKQIRDWFSRERSSRKRRMASGTPDLDTSASSTTNSQTPATSLQDGPPAADGFSAYASLSQSAHSGASNPFTAMSAYHPATSSLPSAPSIANQPLDLFSRGKNLSTDMVAQFLGRLNGSYAAVDNQLSASIAPLTTASWMPTGYPSPISSATALPGQMSTTSSVPSAQAAAKPAATQIAQQAFTSAGPDVVTVPDDGPLFTPARSPSPQQLMDVDIPEETKSFDEMLAPLLDARGQLSDVTHMSQFTKLAGSISEWSERQVVLRVLSDAENTEVWKSFLGLNGLKLVTKMLLQAKNLISDVEAAAAAVSALGLLAKLPVDVNELREVKTGKVVKHFASMTDSEAVQSAASKVMSSWQALVAKPKEVPAGSEGAHAADNEKKRERESSPTEPGNLAKRVKDSKDALPTSNPSAVVDDTDIFVSLSNANLPKIKKTDGAAPAKNTEVRSPDKLKEQVPSPQIRSEKLEPEKLPSYRAKTDNPATSDAGVSAGKKRVRFAEGDKLVAVRYFEKDEHLTDNEAQKVTPHQMGNARDLDRQEGKRAFQRDTVPVDKWTPPPVLNWKVMNDVTKKLEPKTLEWGNESEEQKVQDQRERTTLGTYYTDNQQIPPTPSEPDTVHSSSQSTSPKEILWEPRPAAAAVPAPAAPPPGPAMQQLQALNPVLLQQILAVVGQQQNPAATLLAALGQQHIPPSIPGPLFSGFGNSLGGLTGQQPGMLGPLAAPQQQQPPTYDSVLAQLSQGTHAPAALGLSNVGQFAQHHQRFPSPQVQQSPLQGGAGPVQAGQPHQMNGHQNGGQGRWGNNRGRGQSNGVPNTTGPTRGGFNRGARPGPYDRPPNNKGHPQYKKLPCRFFQQGTCKFGDDCSYRHDMQ